MRNCAAVFLGILALAAQMAIMARAAPTVDVGAATATVRSGPYAATISLENARIALATPGRVYHLRSSIIHNGAWVEPGRAAGKPTMRSGRGAATVTVAYPVSGKRELILEVSAYDDAPGIYIVSRLKNLGAPRSEYYFWSWEGHGDLYQIPAGGKIATVKPGPGDSARFGVRDWVYLPEENGGLAAFTRQTLGNRAAGADTTFLNAIPNNQIIDHGNSMDMGIGLARVPSAAEAARLFARIQAKPIPALHVAVQPQTFADIDYGQPAPKWARNIEQYNCWPSGKMRPTAWTDADLKKWLGGFSLISHIPNDPALIARCRKLGIRTVMYVNFMEMLNSSIQKQAGPKGEWYLDNNWGKIVDHADMDLARHPNWTAYGADGKPRQSVWGAQTNVPGLFNTCLNQADLQDAAVRQVKDIMALGVDGIFIDNAAPQPDCDGETLGKHAHSWPGLSNTEAYDKLLKRIYRTVKSCGADKIVILNSGIDPNKWAYSDVQMWESCLYGSGVVAPTTDWPDAEYRGALQAQALRHGKAPVILSYVDSQPIAVRADRALYTYGFARLYGLGWADWFTTLGPECDLKTARAIYGAHLGKPIGKTTRANGVYSRLFEKGIALVNPDSQPHTVTVAVPHDGALDNIGFDQTLAAKGKRLTVTLPPDSGRVGIWR